MAEPTAPAGFTCIFEIGRNNISNAGVNFTTNSGVAIVAASELATGNYAAWGTWAATARLSRPSRPSGLCAGIGRSEAAYSSRVLQVRHAVSNRSLMPAPLLTSSGRRRCHAGSTTTTTTPDATARPAIGFRAVAFGTS